MSEWTELTWTGISLIIVSVILVMAFSFLSLGKNLEIQMYEDQATTHKLQEIRLTAPYDDTTLSGSEVLAAMLELSGKGVPTVCIVKSSTIPTTDAAAFLMYNESTTAGKSASVFMKDTTSKAYTYLSKSFNPDGTDNAVGFVQRISNKSYTTPAFVANADSFFSTTTFADWSFKSHVVENNGTLLGVYFERVYYTTASGTGEYPTKAQATYLEKVVA